MVSWGGLLAVGILLLLGPPRAFAEEAVLSWDANSESDLAGYTVHYGRSSGAYVTSIPVGLVTTYRVMGLGVGTYYFAVTAESTAGMRSSFSNEVSKTFVDTVAPTISSVVVSAIGATAATVSWTTNEPSTTALEYGLSTAYGQSTPTGSTLSTDHTRLLSNLTPSTAYHFRVISVDGAGNVAISSDYSFTTAAAPDTTPPSISGITSGSISSTGATVSWTTNEPATSQVQYGTTTAYGGTASSGTTQTTSHTVILAALQPATTYHFRVRSTDTAGNTGISGDGTFSTLPAPDTTAPVISGVTASPTSSTTATITWATNELASSSVEYGPGTGYGTVVSDAQFLSAHTLALSGLTASTTYHFRVRSTDRSNNTAVSPDFTFTTTAAPDTTPPTVGGITVGTVTSTSGTVSWTTNEAATSQVEYGTSTAYGALTPVSTARVTSHAVVLTTLQPATTYHFRVRSVDAAGNGVVSSDRSFVTAPAADTSGPVITGPLATDVTSSSAVITWSTDEPATSQVEFGASLSYGQGTPLNSTLVTSHRETLNSLTPGTTYQVRVRSADSAGNESVSGNLSIVIPGSGDTTPPDDVDSFSARGGVRQVMLQWTNPLDTDFVGVQVRFRTDRYPSSPSDGELLGDFTGLPGDNMRVVHENLTRGLVYYYSAATYDQSGNRQNTVYASASPTDSTGTDAGTMAGGCGMIVPFDGEPSGPTQAADWLILAGVAWYLARRRSNRGVPEIAPI